MSSADPVRPDDLHVVPANEASWEDLEAVFGTSDQSGRCLCQRYTTVGWHWDLTQEERRDRLRAQTRCGDPSAPSTSGLVAYLDGEPVAWVAVRPRPDYPRVLRSPLAWKGRQEDKREDGVWAVTCLVVRKGYRGRGITYGLAAATIEHARTRGARAVEAYPMLTEPGQEVTWGELHVGAAQVFEDAGFTRVSHPSKQRVVMRVDF